jgi:hypothetical protein
MMLGNASNAHDVEDGLIIRILNFLLQYNIQLTPRHKEVMSELLGLLGRDGVIYMFNSRSASDLFDFIVERRGSFCAINDVCRS